jgi:hypothetical protein
MGIPQMNYLRANISFRCDHNIRGQKPMKFVNFYIFNYAFPCENHENHGN